MGLVRRIVGLFLLILLIWGGYVAYAILSSPPQLKARWGNVNDTVTEILISGKLNRPLLVPFNLKELTVNFTGVEVAKVMDFNYSPTKPNFTIVVGVDNYRLVDAFVNYMNNGQRGTALVYLRGNLLWLIPIKLDVKQVIQEDVLGQMNFTVESKPLLGGLISTPAVVGTKFLWNGTKNDYGIITAYMKFYNPNSIPLPIGNVSFDVYADGIKLGHGYTERTIIIPAKGYATLPVETLLNLKAIPKVWALHVRNRERSNVKVNVYLTVGVSGRAVEVRLFSQNVTVKTNIMEQINQALQQAVKELPGG
ncbi:LEA type 2 family protein [Thermococcus sp.]